MGEGWQRGRLGDVMRLHYGKALREADRNPGAVPVVGSSGGFARHDRGNAGTSERTLVVGRKGTAGSVTRVNGPAWVTDTAYWAEPSGRVTLDYLFLMLQSSDLPSVCAQTGVPGLNRDRAYEIPVVFPSIAAQRPICAVFDSLDKLAAAAEAAREAAHLGARRLAERLLRPGQEGWDDATLGLVASRRIGRTPPRNQPEYWTQDASQRPFCTIATMNDPRVRSCTEGVTAAAEEAGWAKRVPAGSLLLSFKLSIGRTAVPEQDVFPNEAIAWILPNDSIDQEFLRQCLKVVDWDRQGSRAVKGRTLNKASLDAIPIPVPHMDEQLRLAKILRSAEAAVEQYDEALNRLATVRRHLLSVLLSGEHEIPESYDALLLGAGRMAV